MIELTNKKVLLLGLGLHGGGVATAQWLYKHGAKLIVSDLKSARELKSSLDKLKRYGGIRYVLGKHRDKDVRWADMVVYNPGVPKESPYLKLAKKLAKPVVNEASLFFDRCPCPVIAVTGTRGKSTVASWIAALLRTVNKKTVLAGNIRTTAMLDIVDSLTPKHLVVLELSSWQLEGLALVRKAPDVAVVTNLYPDHLNRYRSLTDYYRSKQEIFRCQTKDDYLILNKAQPHLRSWAKLTKAKVLFFKGKDGAENAAAAITVGRLYKVKESVIKKFLQNPPRLPGRQEIIAVRRGVTFVNDTTSTTPEAGMAALRRFAPPLSSPPYQGGDRGGVILIAGGADKKLNYREWARAVKKHCRAAYLLTGDASAKMAKELRGWAGLHVGYTSLKKVLNDVRTRVRPGDVVLFSPAAASFNLWAHEFERGDDFVSAVKKF